MDDIIAPIAEELNRALGIDRHTLERELTLLIVEYKVPPEEARRSLLKKHRQPAVVAKATDEEKAEDLPRALQTHSLDLQEDRQTKSFRQVTVASAPTSSSSSPASCNPEQQGHATARGKPPLAPPWKTGRPASFYLHG